MDSQKATLIKRGVSLYSFQEEYFLRKMTLEDIIATTQKLDIPGVEIIPDQMIPGYPNISAEFLKQWHGWMDKYGRTPVCMDMFLDWNKYKGRVMSEDERVESITDRHRQRQQARLRSDPRDPRRGAGDPREIGALQRRSTESG